MKEFFETERNFGNLDTVGLICFYRTKNFFTAALLHSRSDHTILNHIMKNISLSFFLFNRSFIFAAGGVGQVSHRQMAEEGVQVSAVINVIIINVIFSIIITRPKPAYGRHGLAGSWGQDTDEVSTFVVFLTSHFAPAALSSDLTNLGPLTMESDQKP